MADRETEIAELKARIAALEARPSAGDLDWLKNSDVWRRAEMAANPRWIKANWIFVSVILAGFLLSIVVAFTH